jgi:hypothetical protein
LYRPLFIAGLAWLRSSPRDEFDIRRVEFSPQIRIRVTNPQREESPSAP